MASMKLPLYFRDLRVGYWAHVSRFEHLNLVAFLLAGYGVPHFGDYQLSKCCRGHAAVTSRFRTPLFVSYQFSLGV